ncbi:MAG: hypothetical protein Hyperionvirus1_199 [Hyperionvirus sp.]|uniref:Uncharacterized protein n=1 Tax=Hyperionvirus sp. TaxID=2487770 RepID=A0A3G5A5T4_9VIRU|nr:MAG: hypothetical protein Hyperionvirus1_199 [Hyperionvirus sp.]
MAAAVSLESVDKGFVPHTVVWNARRVLIDVDRESGLRSDTYRAYEKYNFDKKEPFYLNWRADDVHELLDKLRDNAGLIRVDLSAKGAPTLAAHLMIDVACCQKKDEDDAKKADNDAKEEKLKCIPILKEIAAKIKSNPDKYRCHSIWGECYDCEDLIPPPYYSSTMLKYLSDVPLMHELGDLYKWEWNDKGSRLSMKKVFL